MALLRRNGLILLLALPSLILSCNSNKKNINPTCTTHVYGVTVAEFGNVNFDVTQAEFERFGFDYGDLIDVKIFDWKQIITDTGSKDYVYSPGDSFTFYKMPFVTNYNEVGYYAPCLCNYQKAGNRFDISFGINPFKNHAEELKKHRTQVLFTLVEQGGYNKTLDLVRCTRKATLEEVGYDTSKFANVRDVVMVGDIASHMKHGRYIRGSSPFNPKKNSDNDGRHAVADWAIGLYGANKEISLSVVDNLIESPEEEGKYVYNLAYLMKQLGKTKCMNTKAIYGFDDEAQDASKQGSGSCDQETGPHTFLTVGLGPDYFFGHGKELTKKVFSFLSNATNNDVFYLHCDEGKDRTGFFSMVIEALCGVSYRDIVADFMLTFSNYFGFNKYSDEGRIKYNTIKRITVCRHVLSIFVDNPSNIEWEDIDAERELINTYGVNEESDTTGSKMQEAAKNYLKRLFGEEEGEEVASKIIAYFGK